jgi:hypothetical protein
VRPPVVLDLVVRPPRQAPRDRRPPARTRHDDDTVQFPARLGAAHQRRCDEKDRSPTVPERNLICYSVLHTLGSI